MRPTLLQTTMQSGVGVGVGCETTYLRALEREQRQILEGSRHLEEGNDTGQDEPRGRSQAITFQVAKIQTEDTLPYWFEESQDNLRVNPVTRN